jgi:hypothetical protein
MLLQCSSKDVSRLASDGGRALAMSPESVMVSLLEEGAFTCLTGS